MPAPKHPTLRNAPADLIDGKRVALSGDAIRSVNPARPDETLWHASPVLDHVDAAVDAAARALPEWRSAPREQRFALLRAYRDLCKARANDIAELICDETGKAWWECVQEAGALSAKVDITLDDAAHSGLARVTDFSFPLTQSRVAACRFRPHGVMAVVGPFNFPAHLPNGHIVPALALGNTIVLKPSDKTPAVGQLLAELFHEAGFPAGVINVVQGGAETAKRLVSNPRVDGILFTGSWPVGRAILSANLDNPGRIVALEMGGNNPAIVMPDANLKQAVIEVARCAFNTTGQRCTSTRRVIVHESIADRFIPALIHAARALVIGNPRGLATIPPTPVFTGPIIRDDARRAALAFQDSLLSAGGESLLRAQPLNDPSLLSGFYLSPAIVRVPRFSLSQDSSRDAGCDIEVFGPILRLSLTSSLDDALEQANASRFGLAASIFTHDKQAAHRFLHEARAGCVNVNTGTAGASSKLPFGGLGHSGNHRPAGAFSLDYCAYPVATMVEDGPTATLAEGMSFDDTWLQ